MSEGSIVLARDFITETFDYDGGRQVTMYFAPDPLPEGIVFAGDRQSISRRGQLLETGDVQRWTVAGAGHYQQVLSSPNPSPDAEVLGWAYAPW